MPIDLTGDSDSWLQRDKEEVPDLRVDISQEESADAIRDELYEPLCNHLVSILNSSGTLDLSSINEGTLEQIEKEADNLLDSIGDEELLEIVNSVTAPSHLDEPEQVLNVILHLTVDKLVYYARNRDYLPDPVDRLNQDNHVSAWRDRFDQ